MNNSAWQKIIAQPLSENEILHLVENEAKLVTHEEIAKFETIEQLIGKHKACIILYVTDVNHQNNSVFGHWCCVFKAPWAKGTMSYFDPYGHEPDYSLRFMKPDATQEYGNQPALSNLLQDYSRRGGTVVMNDAPLQKQVKGNAICGRMTGLRLQFRNLDGNQFAALMNSYSKKGVSSDDLASIMTCFLR